jgi:hypothetical protein
MSLSQISARHSAKYISAYVQINRVFNRRTCRKDHAKIEEARPSNGCGKSTTRFESPRLSNRSYAELQLKAESFLLSHKIQPLADVLPETRKAIANPRISR